MTPQSAGRTGTTLALVVMSAVAVTAHAEALPVGGHVDPRIRTAFYDPNQVYQLYAIVGFHLDLEFAPDERFVGLSAGDPKAIAVAVRNDTVLRRYTALAMRLGQSAKAFS